MVLSVADTWMARSTGDKEKRYTYTHELLHLLLLHALLKLALLVGIESKSKCLPSAFVPTASLAVRKSRRICV